MIKTIVLAGDRNYIRQLETTIKSILYHNRDVKIYILNQDIMPDWFRKPRKIARMLGSEIIDVKLPEQTVFQDWEKQDHISSITYARYFIADYIQEDKVLYLDSDLIVNTSLEKLFSICLEEKSLAAVKDTDGITFNTGVLLINNKKWRQEKLKERLIEQSIVTMKEVEEGRFEHFNGDQTIFYQVLQDDWLELGRAYNLQVGHDIVALYNNWQEHLAFNDKPVVIHFTTYRKPWTTLTANRYRDLWWEFHDLEWSQILQHHMGEFELISPLDKEFSCLTLTNSQDLEGIEELVTALPEVVFHIAAWTDMGDKLKKLAVYNNVRLHPQIVPPVLDKLKKSTNLYLDINHGSADIKHLEYLVQRLPDWHFHLAAPCDCSEELTSLSQYTNVTVYQNVLHSRIDWLLDDSIVYLDINTGGEVFNVVTRAQESGKKIFAFDITRKSMDDGLYDGIFSVERPDDLVDRMKNIEIE